MILILLCLAKPWLIVIIFGIFLWAEYYQEMNCPVQKYCDSHQFVSVYIFSDATPHRLIVAIVFHNKNNAVGHCSLSWLFYFIINYYSFNAALYNTPWPTLHCHIGWLLVVCFFPSPVISQPCSDSPGWFYIFSLYDTVLNQKSPHYGGSPGWF